MAVFAVVSSLQNHCLRAVAGQLPNHETSLAQLPVEIKTKLVNLLSKRGLLTDANLGNVSNTLSLKKKTGTGILPRLLLRKWDLRIENVVYEMEADFIFFYRRFNL